MSTTTQNTTVIHANQEHQGIRIAVILLLGISAYLSYLLLSALFRATAPGWEFTMFFSCAGAIPLALAVVWVAEHLLKRTWHSGYSVTLEPPAHLVYQPKEEAPRSFDLKQNFMQTNWYFTLDGYPRGGRERRVPQKWLCLATELQQDDERVLVYTFLPPKKARSRLDKPVREGGFQEIDLGELYDADSSRSRFSGPPLRPEIPTEMLRGKDGRYWLAERRRWKNGLELTESDYITFLRFVEPHQQNAL